MYTRNFVPQLSWSKVNLFLSCPRCFYKDQVLRLKHPGVDPDCFTLNNAVDTLFKSEFDQYRKSQEPHPIMIANNLQAIPLEHDLLYAWRNYKAGGIRFVDLRNNLELYGVVDDVWVNPQQELIVVDYKATSKLKQAKAATTKNKWTDNNKLQIAFYAYLFKRNGYAVHDTGYFVYCLALEDKSALNNKLEFEHELRGYMIDNSWVEPTLSSIRDCLDEKEVPEAADGCSFCGYDLDKKLFNLSEVI